MLLRSSQGPVYAVRVTTCSTGCYGMTSSMPVVKNARARVGEGRGGGQPQGRPLREEEALAHVTVFFFFGWLAGGDGERHTVHKGGDPLAGGFEEGEIGKSSIPESQPSALWTPTGFSTAGRLCHLCCSLSASQSTLVTSCACRIPPSSAL